MQVACPHCDGKIRNDGTYAGQVVSCPFCGQQLQMPALAGSAPVAPAVAAQTVYIAPPKNAGIAAVLSFFWSGLGQIYNGQIGKGIALIIAQFINALLMVVLVGLILYPVVWIWCIYDAYAEAERINARYRRVAA